VFGTSGHLVGGTFLAVLLGPYAAMLSMTIVLLMQAFFFADGGILAFGMNAFNMAVIGGLSFFLIKLFTRGSAGSLSARKSDNSEKPRGFKINNNLFYFP
jgi:cobalt/nickel transport system permease protein